MRGNTLSISLTDVAAELLNSPPRIRNCETTLSARNVFDTNIMKMLINADKIMSFFVNNHISGCKNTKKMVNNEYLCKYI